MTNPVAVGATRRGYIELVIKRLAQCGDLSGDEQAALRALGQHRRVTGRAEIIVGAGVPGFHFLLDGWGCKMRRLPQGRRQIFEIILPGDIIGQFPGDSSQPRFDCMALTTVTTVEATSLAALDPQGRPRHPGILKALTGIQTQARERLLEHVVRLGSRKAYDSVGHLLIELYERQAQVGRASGGRFPLLLGQERLGEMLSLSEVHVNRTLTRLKEDGQLITGAGWALLPRLRELAERVNYPLATQGCVMA